ncbi:MAG: hypothetical protein ACX94B_03770 [Henriciella sp.]|nr:hypothetical protein [Hyphomonadaceae bacterium]
MAEGPKPPNRGRLWMIVLATSPIGLFTAWAFWAQIESGGGMGWVGWLIILMLGIISYSISFYFGHRFFEGTLDQYIVSDTFKKKHDWIDLETETRESGDTKIDGWVAHYKFIRTMFAMGLLPLIACIYLFFFA